MTDESILALIVEGGHSNHQRAFNAFYVRWAQPMQSFFLSRGCTQEDADDVFQETVVKIWKNARQFNGQGTAKAWVWSIARNTLNDHFRRAQKHPIMDALNGDSDDPVITAPEAIDHPDDCVEAGLKLFANIDPDRAYALELWSGGIDLREIGERIGRNYGATRQYLMESRKKLKPLLEPCLEYLTP